MSLSERCATAEDLPAVVQLLAEDFLGKVRENPADLSTYQQAFAAIDASEHHYLMVVEHDGNLVGTCHLTYLPTLTHQGGLRLHIESVRVAEHARGKGVGHWMIAQAIKRAKEKNVAIIQLMTDKTRAQAKIFYEDLGFQSTHEGMKLVLGR